MPKKIDEELKARAVRLVTDQLETVRRDSKEPPQAMTRQCCVERSQAHDAAILPAGRWPPDPLRQHDPVLSRIGRPLERSVRQPTGRFLHRDDVDT
jgi:hypothetical protein